MRIETDIKLDYQDVLLKPKRSKLSSRKEVLMEREFKFLHSGLSFTKQKNAHCYQKTLLYERMEKCFR